MLTPLIAALDAVVPGITDVEDRHRCRLLVAFCLSTVLFSGPFVLVIYRVAGAGPTFWTFLIGDLLMLANLLLLRSTGSTSLIGRLMCFQLLASLGVMAFFNGGTESASFIWLAPIPVLGAFTVGASFGFVCAALASLEIVAFYALGQIGFELPAAEAGASNPWFHSVGLVSLTIFLAAVSWLYEALRHRSARAKNRFLAQVSHEIRTPMNAVLGLSELLLERKLEEQERLYAETIQVSAKSLLEVIDDILDVSRIEAGRIHLQESPFSIERCIANVALTLESMARAKGLSLRTHCDPRLPPSVVGDELRLRQVLVNLLGNAIKFTDRGTVGLRADLTGAEEGPAHVRFTVEDTGIGIPPEVQSLLFEPFEQGRPSPDRRVGAGLGLAISQSLVALMGSDGIRVDSDGEKGARFVFDLELERSEDDPPADAEAPRLPAGLRVLLVDDDDFNQFVAQEMLQKLGCRVECAHDGLEAVARAEALELDVILMDCDMPVVDGFEAARRIRDLEGEENRIPIIALTAHAMASERDACLRAGMDDFLTKPVALRDLAAMLALHSHSN